MRAILLRPIQLASLGLVLLMLASIGIMGWLDWRSLGRLAHIQSGVAEIQAIQEASLEMQRLLIEDVSGVSRLDRAQLATASAALAKVASPQLALDRGTVAKLVQAERALGDASRPPVAALGDALLALRQALDDETRAELALLDVVDEDSRTEMRLVAAAIALLPVGLLLALWLARERFFRPIDNLKDLLAGLGEGNFRPVPVRSVDPLLLPLFDNYNRMVGRLAELEQRHLDHAVELEREVRAATQALLQQSQSLARAERLAAVGELAAAVAHELRNPLAGIHLTLANLRREIADAALARRLDLVVAELQRITRLLNELLAPSRHVPEPRRVVRLAPLVDELLQLTRYQAPPQLELEAHVPADLEWAVPPDGLRQALLNLVLNAMQALGDGPGRITIEVQRDDGAVRVAVRDDGPGFPDALLAGGARAFATGREGGTGLGLAIAQRFAREIQGELRLGNRAPGGACAELRIPDVSGAH
ncbi:MAG TPA: ATP-binding protein [Burkholderiales bacterium]|nr:ATP-binding protein [Burkholderiales bacterium]